MSKRRRSDLPAQDDMDRSLYISFCHAANSISQMYTQAQHQQKIAFQLGQRLGLEKLYEWIQRQHQVGFNPTTFDTMSYLQHELESLVQAEMATVQVQQQSSTVSHLQQQGLPPPFVRAGLPSDQDRFTGFVPPFPSG